MKRFMFSGKESDVLEIKTHLKRSGSIVREKGESLIIHTKEETRLIKRGETITISLSGKLM